MNENDYPVEHGEHVGPRLLRSDRLKMTFRNRIRERIHDRLERGNDLFLEFLAHSTESESRIEFGDEEFKDILEIFRGGGEEHLHFGVEAEVLEEFENVVRVALSSGGRTDVS